MTHELLELKGFFTRQMAIQGQTLAEIERRLGFHQGRLQQGAWFAVATQLPGPDDFEFAGYSQVASHHTLEQYGDLNNPQRRDEIAAYQQQKRNVVASWKLSGSDRLVKVLPTIGHSADLRDDYQYPPGSGIPQWKVIRPIRCRIIGFVGDYPDGRFIPDEGFVAVKYK